MKKRTQNFSSQRKIINSIFIGIFVVVVLIALYFAFYSENLLLSPEEETLSQILPLFRQADRTNPSLGLMRWLCSDPNDPNTPTARDNQGNVYGKVERLSLGQTFGENSIRNFCDTTSTCNSNLPGDVDGDGRVIITDAIVFSNYIAFHSREPICLRNGDCNNDGQPTMADVNIILNNPSTCGAVVRAAEPPPPAPPIIVPTPKESPKIIATPPPPVATPTPAASSASPKASTTTSKTVATPTPTASVS